MNATDKAEALRLEREVRENLAALNDTKAHSCAHVPIVFAMAALDALRSLLSAQGDAEPSAEATPEMCDSVRYLIIALEMAGRTFKSVRQHCEWAGMDTSHWPAWTNGRDSEHFNKSACAALIWHCMQHEQRARELARKGVGNG